MNPTGTLETAKAVNPLKDLLKYGQSVWLDYIRRNLITSGELKRLIEEDGLRGMTSNPSIFEKAIAGSTDYVDFLAELHKQNLRAVDTMLTVPRSFLVISVRSCSQPYEGANLSRGAIAGF